MNNIASSVREVAGREVPRRVFRAKKLAEEVLFEHAMQSKNITKDMVVQVIAQLGDREIQARQIGANEEDLVFIYGKEGAQAVTVIAPVEAVSFTVTRTKVEGAEIGFSAELKVRRS